MKSEIKLFNGKQVLFVDGAPFYAVAGEVHNSDSSSPEYMEKIWKIADDLGMNTLLLPVTWEMTEPEEGTFDFAVPDALIRQARQWGKKIIFLWFGSWKNAQMMYAPSWVKRDMNRFQRAQIVKGEAKTFCDLGFFQMPLTTISYLCKNACEADAKAFAALMAHLREVDEAEGTVIGVQVENEAGLNGASREHSDAADAAFAAQVPEAFASYMRAHTDTMHPDVRRAVEQGAEKGSWSEVFGPIAEEIFSAYHVASFVGEVAKRGRAEYDLPMFANAWLVHKGDTPGLYPSGGPVTRVHEVWRYCAPSIDVLCPDIYVREFMEVCDDYSRHQALFIPEVAIHSYAASRLVYCIGHYHAMGFSPFGFDDIGHPFDNKRGYVFGMDVTDPALNIPQDFEIYASLSKALCDMMPMIAERYGTDALQAIAAERGAHQNVMDFGKLRVEATFSCDNLVLQNNGVVLGAQINPEEYYLLCYQTMLDFKAGDAKHLDILELTEGTFEGGRWHPGRRLNGDETTIMCYLTPRILHLRIHTFDDYQ